MLTDRDEKRSGLVSCPRRTNGMSRASYGCDRRAFGCLLCRFGRTIHFRCFRVPCVAVALTLVHGAVGRDLVALTWCVPRTLLGEPYCIPVEAI